MSKSVSRLGNISTRNFILLTADPGDVSRRHLLRLAQRCLGDRLQTAILRRQSDDHEASGEKDVLDSGAGNARRPNSRAPHGRVGHRHPSGLSVDLARLFGGERRTRSRAGAQLQPIHGDSVRPVRRQDLVRRHRALASSGHGSKGNSPGENARLRRRHLRARHRMGPAADSSRPLADLRRGGESRSADHRPCRQRLEPDDPGNVPRRAAADLRRRQPHVHPLGKGIVSGPYVLYAFQQILGSTLLEDFPKLRVAFLEAGSEWTVRLVKGLRGQQ